MNCRWIVRKPLFNFAGRVEIVGLQNVAEKILREAGFGDIDVTVVDCAWDLDDPRRLCEIYEKGTVRAAMVLSKQPSQNLAAIRQAISEAVQARFAHDGRWRVPVPAALVRAVA